MLLQVRAEWLLRFGRLRLVVPHATAGRLGKLDGHGDGPPVPDDTGPLAATLTEAIRHQGGLHAGAYAG